MRITQGTFSFLPDLTDAQITRQIDYCLEKGWALAIETTDDPHPRNTYWEMFGPPMPPASWPSWRSAAPRSATSTSA
jgi:ribulose-bisphosphate carboxylase small chain